MVNDMDRLIAALEKIEAGVVPKTDPDTGIWIECNMSEDEMQDIAREALARYRAAREAVGKPTPPSFATSA